MGRRTCIRVLLASSIAFGPSCGGSTGPDGVVRGEVHHRGAPVEGAEIVMGTQSMVTGLDGRFEFSAVFRGRHELTATYAIVDSGFVSRTLSIETGGGADVGTIVLPDPVGLTSPAVSDRTVTLSWTPTDDPGFREYKIYRSYTSGLDESTGELVHIETDREANTWVDGAGWEGRPISPGTPVRPESPYYYRVFVLDELGLLAGSNVVGVRTRRYPIDAFEVEYDLVQVDQFAGEGKIAGLTFDGSCFWIAYLEVGGGYWDDKTVRLVCRDVSTGDTRVEYEYTDDFRVPRGLTWDGTYLWIQYDNEGSTIRAINPADGSEVRRFAIRGSAWDLAWDGESILIAYRDNRLEFVDPSTGGVVNQLVAPFPTRFMTSVAYRDGEIWLLENASNHAIVLAPDGRHIGIADVNVLPGDWRSGETSLAFVNDELAVTEEGRVFLLQTVPR